MTKININGNLIPIKPTLIYGDAGSGKSSLLKLIIKQLNDAEISYLYYRDSDSSYLSSLELLYRQYSKRAESENSTHPLMVCIVDNAAELFCSTIFNLPLADVNIICILASREDFNTEAKINKILCSKSSVDSFADKINALIPDSEKSDSWKSNLTQLLESHSISESKYITSILSECEVVTNKKESIVSIPQILSLIIAERQSKTIDRSLTDLLRMVGDMYNMINLAKNKQPNLHNTHPIDLINTKRSIHNNWNVFCWGTIINSLLELSEAIEHINLINRES